MKTISSYFPNLITYFFVLLFTYASISKLLDFENFQVQIAQSPLLSAYAGFISYFTIVIELFCVVLLIVPKMRLLGLYMSLGLMAAFSIYIYLILNYSDFVPCSCGGILEKMGWKEHLIFNIVCVFMAVGAISILSYQKGTSTYHSIVQQFVSIVFSCCLVVYLFYSSEYIIKKENNFTRRFFVHSLQENKAILLENNNFYFAGNDDKYIYLGNKSSPQIFKKIDIIENKSYTYKINLTETKLPYTNLRLFVNAPYYYLMDGSVPIIYRGKIGSTTPKIISYKDAYFSQAIAVDSSNIIIRTMDSKTKQITLGNLKIDRRKNTVKIIDNLFKKQIDGVFDSDGKLQLDKKHNKILYLYSYRNQLLIMNKHLSIEKVQKTIDTISFAKLQATQLSNGQHKLQSPPTKVNQNMAVSGSLAFIQSEVRGKYEDLKTWQNHKIIDVYELTRNEYLGSIKVDKRKGISPSDYLYSRPFFFAIYDNQLIKYSVRQTIINSINKGDAENPTKE